jgi:polar amino acid transport system substrate-binding protein
MGSIPPPRSRRYAGAKGVAALLAGLAVAMSAPIPTRAEERPLRVGIDRSYPPFEFVDERGRPSGFAVDLFEVVAKQAGLRYEFVVREWPEIRAALEAGELDLSLSVFRTPVREPLLGFSVPTAWVHHTLFVRDDTPIEGAADLRGRRVLVQRSGPHDDLLREQIPGVELVLTDTSSDALRRLAAGEADAAVALDILGLWAIRAGRLSGVRSLGVPLDEMELRFAVPRDREELLAALNDGLTVARENGSYDRVYDRWFGILQAKGVPLRRVLWGAGALAAVAAAGLGWSVLLRRLVERRTGELLRSQVQKRALEHQLLQIEKTEALGRLAAGVAHDFNNMLAVILGNLRLAQQMQDERAGLRRALDAIEAATRSAMELVEQLFLYGRSEPGTPRQLDWNEVVRGSEQLMRRVLPKGIQLDLRLDPEPGRVELDPAQARQLVMNLLLNARDALEKSGTIEVATSLQFRDGAWWSVLEVRDDGPGMDAATLDRIFDPFFTTKGTGTGLGLATVHVIVSRAGGHIDVRSGREEGTGFALWLPAVG